VRSHDLISVSGPGCLFHTMYTIRFNIQVLFNCIYVLRIILIIKTDNFPNFTKRLVFVMDTQCVLCETGTIFLKVI
jgi:hypothetical protein